MISSDSALEQFCAEAERAGFMIKKPNDNEQQLADEWVACHGFDPQQVQIRGRYIIGRNGHFYTHYFYETEQYIRGALDNLRGIARKTIDEADSTITLGYQIEHHHPTAFQIVYRELVSGSGTIRFIHPHQYDRLMIRVWRVADRQR